jgi:crotonobetainyl-CoA:carnitine CoA-transferase CaiB-like acyl-CoA transferase
MSEAETDTGTGALAGIRVLDFSRFQQGPYSTLLLADLGAEVVRIERPGGEWDRELRTTPDGFSGFFYGMNRGKRSVAIDVATEHGRTAVIRMVAQADVVVENFRPGVMDRLGLGYDALRTVNPRIIYAAANGWGPDGPNAPEPMYDMVAQAVSGVADFNRDADGRPRLATRGYADAGGATFLAMGILAALFVRERTGDGQRVDASLVGACIGLHAQELGVCLNQQRLDRPGGRVTPTSGAFRCRDDRWLVVAATDQKLWAPLCRAVDRLELLNDMRFADRPGRLANRADLERMLEAAFLERDRDDWLSVLRQADIPVGPVNTFLDLPDDTDAVANGYIIEGSDPVWGKRFAAGLPFHLLDSNVRPKMTMPALGEHTEAEMERVGYTKAEIDLLDQTGVLQRSGGGD